MPEISQEELDRYNELKQAAQSSNPELLTKTLLRNGWRPEVADTYSEPQQRNAQGPGGPPPSQDDMIRYIQELEGENQQMRDGIGQLQHENQLMRQGYNPNPMNQPIQRPQTPRVNNFQPEGVKQMQKIAADLDKKYGSALQKLTQSAKEKELAEKEAKRNADFEKIVTEEYNEIKDKLTGLKNEDQKELIKFTMDTIQQKYDQGERKIDAKQVLTEINNVQVGRINKFLEAQGIDKSKKLVEFEYKPEPEGGEKVPTLGAESTDRSNVGVKSQEKGQQQKPKEGELAPDHSMAKGQHIIHEEIVPSKGDEIGALEDGTKASEIPAVRAAVEAEERAEQATEDTPIGKVEA